MAGARGERLGSKSEQPQAGTDNGAANRGRQGNRNEYEQRRGNTTVKDNNSRQAHGNRETTADGRKSITDDTPNHG